MITEKSVGIIVTARDRIATTSRTLRVLTETTPATTPIVVVIGGAPSGFEEDLRRQFQTDRFHFVFEPKVLSPAEGRNVGLRHLDTELAAIVDTDVVPRPGWLEALLDCHASTGAATVVPIILERDHVIHCAGTDLYVDVCEGVALAHKHLRYFEKPYHEGTNLERSRLDYGELHCQLVDRVVNLELEAFDEAILEGGEVDQGLTLRDHGHEVWFEPRSVVLFDRFSQLHAVDIDQFTAKWDIRGTIDGLEHFFNKWGVDLSEDGRFLFFMSDTNAQLGKLARRSRSELGVAWSSAISTRMNGWLRRPTVSMLKRRRRRWGQAEWQAMVRSTKRRSDVEPHPIVGELDLSVGRRIDGVVGGAKHGGT